jgi:hypothetical protein
MSIRHQSPTMYELTLLLKQYEVAGYSPERLDKLLGAEINRAQSLNVELRPALRLLRHSPLALMVRCEEAITRAQAARDRRDFRQGLKALKEAQRLLKCLQELLEDAAELEAVVTEYEGLLTMLDSEYLSGLPSITSLAHVLSEADALFAVGATADNLLAAARGRQARFIARLYREKLYALQAATDGEEPKARRLASIIREQSDYCEHTSAFAPAPSSDRKVQQAFERLSDLLADGRLTLLARLTDDIESELASRRTVLATFQRYLDLRGAKGAAAVGEAAMELKRIIDGESWGRAATYLLQQTLALLADKGSALQASAREVTQKLDATKAAGELALAELGSSNN